MYRRTAVGYLAMGMTFGMAGCAARNELVDPNGADLSVVAGHIDMRDAPTGVDWVSLKAYGEGRDSHYKMGVFDGTFFHIGVKPGSYQIDKFAGQNRIAIFGGAWHEYAWASHGRNDSAVRITQRDVYFLGSWQYQRGEGSLLGSDSFRMLRAQQPTREEVLGRVLKHVEQDERLRGYARQIALLRARIGAS